MARVSRRSAGTRPDNEPLCTSVADRLAAAPIARPGAPSSAASGSTDHRGSTGVFSVVEVLARTVAGLGLKRVGRGMLSTWTRTVDLVAFAVGGLLADGSGSEHVISQEPRAGVAAAPGMPVKLVVAG